MTAQTTQTTSCTYEDLIKSIGLAMDSELLYASLVTMFGTNPPEPEHKVYSDGVYVNYYTAGCSLFYVAEKGYRPKAISLDRSKLQLKSIDVYNKRSEQSTKKQDFSLFSSLPLVILKPGGTVEIASTTTGKELVEALGEPPRKGGGDGPSSGSIDIWCEWPTYGLMVEFDQRGPQAWERGKDATWKVVTVFQPTEA